MYSLKEMKGEKALVTGGLGFIGSNLTQKLVSLGCKVTVLDACVEGLGWNFANVKEIKGKIKFVKADVRDSEEVRKAIEGQNMVFHCAAQVSHVDSMKDPFPDLDMNVKGTLVLLEQLRKFNDSAQVVYCGTRGQIGKAVFNPITENHPDNPTDVYGIDKLAAEKHCLLYGRIYGMKACSLRLNNTFGPRHQMRHNKYGILNWFLRQAMLGETITIYGEGKQTRDYNYVDDAVDAMVLAAQSSEARDEVFLLGSGKEIPLFEAVNSVVRAAGSGAVTHIPWPKERQEIEVGNFFVSFEKIRKKLGWKPKTGFEDGLRKTVGFYKERKSEYF